MQHLILHHVTSYNRWTLGKQRSCNTSCNRWTSCSIIQHAQKRAHIMSNRAPNSSKRARVMAQIRPYVLTCIHRYSCVWSCIHVYSYVWVWTCVFIGLQTCQLLSLRITPRTAPKTCPGPPVQVVAAVRGPRPQSPREAARSRPRHEVLLR